MLRKRALLSFLYLSCSKVKVYKATERSLLHRRHHHHRRRRRRRCHRHRCRHRLHCRCRRQRDGPADERPRLHGFFSAGQLGSQFVQGLARVPPCSASGSSRNRLNNSLTWVADAARQRRRDKDVAQNYSPVRCKLAGGLTLHPRPRAINTADAQSESLLRHRAQTLH